MEISSVTNQAVTDTTVKKNGGDLGKDEFLKILAAQLQFQDPMEGGDNSAYVAQLAQFSSLEQMENLNSSLNELKGNQNLLYGTLLIGKMVNLAFGDQMVSGVVDKVKLVDSMLKVIVGGQEYDAGNILTLEDEEEVVPVVSGEEVIE
ncbi:MAG: hypothetical protein J7L51_02570 [Desulfurococcales archaeon]|nr:hypothetical protein [Desulfurococcales archaeon]